MKKYYSIVLFILLFSSCTKVVSMYVDDKPSLMPEELSNKLSERYSEIGLYPHDQSKYPSLDSIGAWRWFEKESTGLTFHYIKKGSLKIWIVPAQYDGGAPEIKEKFLGLLSETAPDASIEIKEFSKFDTR